MNIVIAPDSFKGSMTAKEAANAIERGIRRVCSDICIEKVPMADGGEGTVQSLIDATNGTIIKAKVRDSLYRIITAKYGILGNGMTAVIEMAEASGLTLLKEEERNPMITTTFGTGEIIKDALDRGCREFIIGIGGSATNDGGTGMLMALGCKFFDRQGKSIKLGGEGLSDIVDIDTTELDSRLKESKFVIACDVDNPLCGPRGAAEVFGPQKGATEEMIKLLDNGLRNLAEIIEKKFNEKIIDYPGAGAAGGLGAALKVFMKGDLKRGINIVISATNLEEKIKECDLVITGEGGIDYQTQFGKTPYGVAQVATMYNKPIIAIAGSIGKDAEVLYDKGFTSIFSIVDRPMSLEESMKSAENLLEKSAERILRLYLFKNNK